MATKTPADLRLLIDQLWIALGSSATDDILRKILPTALEPLRRGVVQKTFQHDGPYPFYHKNNKVYGRQPGTLRRSIETSVGTPRSEKIRPAGFITSEHDPLANIVLNSTGTKKRMLKKPRGEQTHTGIMPASDYSGVVDQHAAAVINGVEAGLLRHIKRVFK